MLILSAFLISCTNGKLSTCFILLAISCNGCNCQELWETWEIILKNLCCCIFLCTDFCVVYHDRLSQNIHMLTISKLEIFLKDMHALIKIVRKCSDFKKLKVIIPLINKDNNGCWNSEFFFYANFTHTFYKYFVLHLYNLFVISVLYCKFYQTFRCLVVGLLVFLEIIPRL